MLGVLLILLQLLGWIGALVLLVYAALWALSWVVDWRYARQRARRLEIEAVLDRKQQELRGTILRLADALAEERVHANQASAEMIRAAYLSRGQLPS